MSTTNGPCKPARLTLREYGAAGDASDIIVKCVECGVERRMADAFDRDQFRDSVRRPPSAPATSGSKRMSRRGTNDLARRVKQLVSPCDVRAHASSRKRRQTASLVEENWSALKDLPSLDVARYVTAPSRMPFLVEFTAEQIWSAIEDRRNEPTPGQAEDEDLKVAEWERLTQSPLPTPTKEFLVTRVPPPSGFGEFFEETVLVERLREVRALLAFTRIESKGDFADAAYVDDGRETPLSRQSPTVAPGIGSSGRRAVPASERVCSSSVGEPLRGAGSGARVLRVTQGMAATATTAAA